MITNKPLPHPIVITLVLAALWWLVGCHKQSGTTSVDGGVDYYTCTMHPSVHLYDPKAKCPICSMDLVPVMKTGLNTPVLTEKPAKPILEEFSVPVARQQQIGVTYASAETQPLHHTIRSVGMVVPDKMRQWSFVARVEGYVQTLYVASPGEAVEEGQPLLTIYSPGLLTAEREFVNLLDTRSRASTPDGTANADRVIESARRRLAQWNITPKQIADLEKSRLPSEILTLNSPFKGVVEDVPVNQGRKVVPGDSLATVADLSVVWVWAEFYEDELSMIEKGQKVRLTAKAYPGQNFAGEVSLVNPFLTETERTAKIRIDVANADFRLHPGMYVNIELEMDMGEGLTIPVSAIMPTGSRSLVFVDKGAGKLEPRLVQLGGKYGDRYEVLDGLKEGERVVTSANFLIDAESKVQGAVKSFEDPDASVPAEVTQKTHDLYSPMIATYLAMQEQLAQDKFDGLNEQLVQFRSEVKTASQAIPASEETNKLRLHIDTLTMALEKYQSDTLFQARVDFGTLSAAFIDLLGRCAAGTDFTFGPLSDVEEITRRLAASKTRNSKSISGNADAGLR